MIELELPFPPVGEPLLPPGGAADADQPRGAQVRERVCCAPRGDRGSGRLTGPLRVEIEVYPPDRRRRDIDNVQKALLDALEHGGAYRDDSQIVELTIEKRECVPAGRTLVRI